MQDHPVSAISVVYPTCGRPELLLRSLAALLAGDELPEEIVIVDQSREEATPRALAQLGDPRVVHVASAERGLSRARNLGIRASRHPLIGFIDDDCIPARDWIASARRAVAASAQSAVWIGALVPGEQELAAPDPRPERRRSLRGTGDPWSVGPTGGNSFFRSSVFDHVGPFDPELGQGSRFPGAEDGDMIFRVLKNGLEVTFTSTIRVYHIGWRSDLESADNGYNYGVGVGALLAKLLRGGDHAVTARIFARRFLAKYLEVPYYLVLGRRHEGLVSLRWSQGIIRGFIEWRKAHPRR